MKEPRRAWLDDSPSPQEEEKEEVGEDQENLTEEGGVKKIIYNGSTKKRSLFDDDDSYNQQWNFKTQQQNNAKSGQFNLDDVWSIKKNVGVNKSPVANPTGGSFWERGAGKGYYSRHGGLSDEESGAPVTSTQGSGGFYSQSKNYSYSYGNPASDKLQAPSAGGSTNTSPRGGNNLMRPGASSTMNNGLTNGSAMSNGHSHNMGSTGMGSTGMGSMGMGPMSQGRHGGPVSSRYQGPVSNNPRKF